MGLDFSFRDEHQIQFGRCGVPKQTIVEVSLPIRPGDVPEGKIFSPDSIVHFVRNTHKVDRLNLKGQPSDGGGYALVYTSFVHTLTEAEALDKFRAIQDEHLPLDHPRREEILDAHVADFALDMRRALGTSFIAGMMIQNNIATITENRFLRWVDKKEFEQVVSEVKAKLGDDYEGEDCPVAAYNQWYFEMEDSAQRSLCIRCDLNTQLDKNPLIDQAIQAIDQSKTDPLG